MSGFHSAREKLIKVFKYNFIMLRVVQENKRLISEEEKKNGKTKEINQPDPARDWRLPTSANPASRLGGSFLHGDRLCLRMPALQRPSGTAKRSRFLRFRAS